MHFIPLNYSDPGFNPAYTADFQLVIIVNQDEFDYAVCHPVTNRLTRIVTGRPLAELFDPQNQEIFAVSKYQKVTIAVNSGNFCLIPDAVFTRENLADFAAFLSVKEADLILTDQVEQGKNTVIFTLPEIVIQKITGQYPSVKIQFAPKSWIKTVFEAKLPGQNLHLFIQQKTIKILFTDQQNIRFYNQFEFTAIDEIVYFTALVADQLKLKPAETNLILCGTITAESEPVLRLQAFFKAVSMFSTSDFMQKDTLQQHQLTQFLGLN